MVSIATSTLFKPLDMCFRFDEELIHTACGILEVNSFEVRCPNGALVQGLYPQTAIMSHSCVPNTSHCIISSEDNRQVLVQFVNFRINITFKFKRRPHIL